MKKKKDLHRESRPRKTQAHKGETISRNQKAKQAKPVKKGKKKQMSKTAVVSPVVYAPVEYEWRTVTTLPPPNGRMGTNTGDWGTSVNSIYASSKDRFGVDTSAAIASIKSGDKIKLTHSTNTAITSTWSVTGVPQDKSGYFTIAVSRVSAAGVPNASNNVHALIIPAGAVTDVTALGQALRGVLQRIWDDRQLRYRVVDGIRYCAVCGREDNNSSASHDPSCLQGPMSVAMNNWDIGTGTTTPKTTTAMLATSPVTLLPRP